MSDEDRLAELLDRWEEQDEQGTDIPAEQLCRDCPELTQALAEQIADLKFFAVFDRRSHGSEGDRSSLGQRGEDRKPTVVGGVPLCPGAEPILGYRLLRHL